VTLLPDPPMPSLSPEMTTPAGPWGGPTYSYRGARIECMAGAHVCGLFLAEHPLDGQTFGIVQTIKSPWVETPVHEWLARKGQPLSAWPRSGRQGPRTFNAHNPMQGARLRPPAGVSPPEAALKARRKDQAATGVRMLMWPVP
jgi:hypothetical protein